MHRFARPESHFQCVVLRKLHASSWLRIPAHHVFLHLCNVSGNKRQSHLLVGMPPVLFKLQISLSTEWHYQVTKDIPGIPKGLIRKSTKAGEGAARDLADYGPLYG